MKGALCQVAKSWQIQTESVLRNLSVSSKCILAHWSSCFNKQIVLEQWNKMPTRLFLVPELTKELFLLCFREVAFSVSVPVQCKSYVENKSKWDVWNSQLKCKIGSSSVEPLLPTAAADLHWHLLQHPLTCLTWLCPHCTPPSSLSPSPAPGQHPGPLTNRIKWGKIWKKLNDDKLMTASVQKHRQADTQQTQIRERDIWKGANGGCKYRTCIATGNSHRDVICTWTPIQGNTHTHTDIQNTPTHRQRERQRDALITGHILQ